MGTTTFNHESAITTSHIIIVITKCVVIIGIINNAEGR
jgi:hypothetical protein